MSEQNMLIHLIAGGVAGTTGAILTSPLEVVKIRFQANQKSYKKIISTSGKQPLSLCDKSSRIHSSSSQFGNNGSSTFKSYSNILLRSNHGGTSGLLTHSFSLSELNHHHHNHNSHPVNTTNGANFDSVKNYYGRNKTKSKFRMGKNILLQLKTIVENEGLKGLFKGLGPNIVGVAPYRAIYFFSYANSKNFLVKNFGEERPVLHIASAFAAGFSAVTITNPIWFIKTRLQLDETRRGLTTLEVIQKIMREKGPLGFYKGISASYFGIAESALYFVLYEKLKSINKVSSSDQNLSLFTYLTSAGFSKTLASCICYPHEVTRTRLRLEGDKYRGFFQTLRLIVHEEGARGLYKGMATHLIRQIPNTAIVMTTYELIINYWSEKEKSHMLPSDDE